MEVIELFGWMGIICLIIIVIFAVQYVIQRYTHFTIKGGSGGGDLSEFDSKHYRKLIMPDNALLTIDGNNIIYSLKLDKNKTYSHTIVKVSSIIRSSVNSNNIHFILKNKNSNKKDIEKFIDDLRDISTKVDMYFDLAVDYKSKDFSTKVENKHSLKGRDDFLTIYLGKDGYIISRDKFRDYNEFVDIPKFTWFQIHKGKIVKEEILDPKYIINSLYMKPPNIGQQYSYYIMDEVEQSIHSLEQGSIYINPEKNPKGMNYGVLILYK